MSISKDHSKRLHVVEHPILKHKLGLLRDKNTPSYEFRNLVEEITSLLIYEATRKLDLTTKNIETPYEATQVERLKNGITAISIMRAGNIMLNGVLKIVPTVTIGHVGIYRDKFLNTTVEYFFKVPQNMEGKQVIMVDLVLATGATILAALTRLNDYYEGPVTFICLLATEVGVSNLLEKFPDLNIYCISLERELSGKGQLLPGLGDAGERLYGTM